MATHLVTHVTLKSTGTFTRTICSSDCRGRYVIDDNTPLTTISFNRTNSLNGDLGKMPDRAQQISFNGSYIKNREAAIRSPEVEDLSDFLYKGCALDEGGLLNLVPVSLQGDEYITNRFAVIRDVDPLIDSKGL